MNALMAGNRRQQPQTTDVSHAITHTSGMDNMYHPDNAHHAHTMCCIPTRLRVPVANTRTALLIVPHRTPVRPLLQAYLRVTI